MRNGELNHLLLSPLLRCDRGASSIDRKFGYERHLLCLMPLAGSLSQSYTKLAHWMARLTGTIQVWSTQYDTMFCNWPSQHHRLMESHNRPLCRPLLVSPLQPAQMVQVY
jgi:hypothetical protein